jgi:hypothetical protein
MGLATLEVVMIQQLLAWQKSLRSQTSTKVCTIGLKYGRNGRRELTASKSAAALLLSSTLAGLPIQAQGKILQLDFSASILSIFFVNGAAEAFGLTPGATLIGSIVFDSSTSNSGPNNGVPPDPENLFWRNSIVYAVIPHLFGFQGGYSLVNIDLINAGISFYANSLYSDSNNSGGISDVMSLSLPSKEVGSLQGGLVGLSIDGFRQEDTLLTVMHSIYLVESGLYKSTIVFSKVTSLDISAIPSSSTLTLFGLGLVVIFRSQRFFKRLS